MLSVIIATHNRSALLGRTLQALVRQSLPPSAFEIVVVDNGSSDGTAEAVRAFARQHPAVTIHLLHESRPGKSWAVNTGVAAARGDLLAFTDDDVVPDEGWLSAIARAMDTSRADFCVGRIRPLWEVPPPAWLSPRLYGVLAVPDNGPIPLPVGPGVNEQVMPIGANMALRRSVVARLGGWRPELGKLRRTLRSGEDHEFYLRMLDAGLTGVYEPAAIVAHLVPAERLCRRYFTRWLHDNGRIVAGIEREFPPHARFLLGVPRYLWREAATDTLNLARTLVAGSAADRFASTTRLLWFAGYLRGAWGDRAASRAGRLQEQ